MTIIRKLGEFFGSLIFSISLGILIVLIALANFTEYGTLQPIVTKVVQDQLSNQANDIYSATKQECDNNVILDCASGNFTTTSSSEATVCLSNLNVSISCDTVQSSQPNNLTQLIAANVFNQTYFRNYECSFLECTKGFILPQNSSEVQNQQFQVILTAKANEFFSSMQVYLIAGTIIGLILIIVSVRVWYKILKVVGITLIFVGIIYLLIPFAKDQISNFTQLSQQQEFSLIVDALFSPILSLLRATLILGIVLTATGYIFAFLLKHDEKPKEEQKKSTDVI